MTASPLRTGSHKMRQNKVFETGFEFLKELLHIKHDILTWL